MSVCILFCFPLWPWFSSPRERDSIVSITGRLWLLRGLSALWSSIAMLKGTLGKSTLAVISLTQWNTATKKKKSPFVGIILLFPGERCHFALDYQDNCLIFSTLLCQWPKCYYELWILCLVSCSSKLCVRCFFAHSLFSVTCNQGNWCMLKAFW